MTSDMTGMANARQPDAEMLYSQRSEQFAAEAKRCGRHAGKLVFARAITFLAGAGCLLLALLDPGLRAIWLSAGGILILVFIAFATLDDWFKRRQEHLLQLQRVNQWLLARKRRDWKAVPVPGMRVPDEHMAVAHDLDLFGEASLFQLLCLARTPRGKLTLRDWILEPADPDEIRQRQAAVQELAPEWKLREQLLLRGHLLSRGRTGPDSFVQWADSEPLQARYHWLKWTSRALPILGGAAAVVLVTGALTANVSASLVVAVLVLNVLLSVVFNGRVHDILDRISTRSGEMTQYLALFEMVEQMPHASTRLARIHAVATAANGGAIRELRRLSWIMKLAALRHDPSLSVFYFALQAAVLWDFHVLWILERWQRRCRSEVRRWFDALGELESLSSLAGLAFEHPEWCFPTVDQSVSGESNVILGKNLGHPLLNDKVRVTNDVQVGPTGTVLLVTGSNMSGKSTLLRSIGLNCMLAEAGGPVCATSLRMPSLTVATSMRIQDSLQDGVSFFMAELKRLKGIVDQARAYRDRQDRTLLYLLDEILQGTNSVERHMAVTRVLSHLIAQQAIGAVSTHDLQLASAPELAQYCRAVHFRETLHNESRGQSMTFDYRLRQGVATTTNAMKLLEMVGLTQRQDHDRDGE